MQDPCPARLILHDTIVLIICGEKYKSTDHELIPARNASLAATQGFASGIFVTIQPENIRPSKEEINNTGTMLKLPDVCS
jgi:hypothetical protein